jgi:hypothetical protein
MTDLPKTARHWPAWVQDRFNERAALMREGNRIPDDQPLPFALLNAAITEAGDWMELEAQGQQRKLNL